MSQIQFQEGVEIYVLIFRIIWVFLEKSVGYLGVKDFITVNLVLSDKGGSVFVEIVEHLNDLWIFQYLLKLLGESIQLNHVKEETMRANANLYHLLEIWTMTYLN